MTISKIYKGLVHSVVISRNVEFMRPGNLKSLPDDSVFIYKFGRCYYE